MHLPRNILVPTDFSANAGVALDYAVALAAKLDARVHLVHVMGAPIISGDYAVDPASMVVGVTDDVQLELDRLVAAHGKAAAFGPATLRTGDAQGVIHAVAAEVDADLIVMGSQGRRGLSRLLLGSVAESVARTAACPVLLVREGAAT